MMNLLQVLLIAISSLSPSGKLETTVVDLMELNHVQVQTNPVMGYSQVILWQWSPDYRRYDCEGWYLVDPKKLEGLPAWTGQRWTARRRGQQFHAKIFRETTTSYDPERESRKLKPEPKK
jgi:hypothetical protein